MHGLNKFADFPSWKRRVDIDKARWPSSRVRDRIKLRERFRITENVNFAACTHRLNNVRMFIVSAPQLCELDIPVGLQAFGLPASRTHPLQADCGVNGNSPSSHDVFDPSSNLMDLFSEWWRTVIDATDMVTAESCVLRLKRNAPTRLRSALAADVLSVHSHWMERDFGEASRRCKPYFWSETKTGLCSWVGTG